MHERVAVALVADLLPSKGVQAKPKVSGRTGSAPECDK
jgi:hypothetical protein